MVFMKYFDLLKEICLELGISFKILSDNYVLELEYKGIRKYIYAHKFPLNDQGLSSILDDKYATYCVLKEHNIPTIEMEPIYYPYSKDYINKKFSNNEKIILKTTHGSRGNQVFKIENSEECFRKLDELFKNDLGSPVCLSPYYDIKAEYRVIVLNKKIKLIYGKKKPIIVGNGSSTILELLKEFNPHYYQKKDLKIENPNKVLKAGEVLEYDFRFNLSKGANVFLDIEASVLEKLKKIALEV